MTCCEYLLRVAGGTVRVVGDRVVVRHVYTERRVTPLNIFLRDAGESAATRHRDRLRQRHQGPRRGRHFHG